MKTLLRLLVLVLLTQPAFAVTWKIVSVSVIVKQSSATGRVTTTLLSSRSYINFVSDRDSIPASDLFVGFRTDTGEIAVVSKSDKTVRQPIVRNLAFGSGGQAENGTQTVQFIAVPASVSSLNTEFNGYIYDSATRASSGSVKSVTRTFVGGFQNQTIKGSCKTTGKQVIL